ncbi:hypothetical protein [Streptomyces hoynatensis]|uniref:PH domain-containing protein n=1 Tax=Streptomyces hoynatensis TaxID=1141874 RepID=A0A3A9YRP5_9ACTN|nr:hypothetical protein [Streptomyces hoynatensis]RKN38712.1 hypothetical protein D7294_23040 [Streptomyces hoynatensis]
MPLTFLAADRDASTAAQPDVPLPHSDQDYWRRPYRLGPWRVGIAAVILLISAYLMISALIIALAGPPAGAGVTVGTAVVTIALALRLLRMGIWVSSRGLRRVGLLGTRTLRWREISRVHTVQQPVKWLGLPRTVQGQGLLVERHHGEPLRMLLTDHSADFLGRPEVFDRAADTIEAWAAEHQ